MKKIILHILCEGQTEERFAKKVLAPYLAGYHISTKPVLLLTSKKKNARGGMVSYTQAQGDMTRMLQQHTDNDFERHIYSTMFDYYALPFDFPGFDQAKRQPNVRQAIQALETEFQQAFPTTRLIPYIQLHEFEALLFTDIEKLSLDYPHSTRAILSLKKETDGFRDPEMINQGPSTAPSKRIIKALDGQHRYNKVMIGTNVTQAIGMPSLLSRCQHFSQWIEAITHKTQQLLSEK
ncbi:MAG: DUF4276 family protein [Ruminococcus sp.]|nr:DUF4276 family protein [Ruminococcus sp.]